ncbi:protein dopey-1-like isoform X4 [Saccostrea cucullata]|uniref:protein dopey-1-like isoform X4 n=1 Tax=Saccostrea cuccullata TaxID=36930 RepID=UPI002ED423CB
MSALTILAEECELLNDSKYRSYISQVEKALKSFEYTSEWADLISALGKLNKVLVGHTKYPVIPKRVTIGKRLAQCLHPALPSGVHLKALETYDIIFKCIGTRRLAQDLFIYSAGLFPLLGHAAMGVKPVLLTLYERHFVALKKDIKPGLNGLLLGLLPGLEEGSELLDRTILLLEDFCSAAGPEYFYTCLWECVKSCPSVRLPAITYLLYHYNKKQTMEDQLFMMGLNIDLMVEALCGAIQDSNVLVQRSLLDFMMLAFPMHNAQLTKSDMSKIVLAVVNVVLRRDMSLNRRLYSWLLGSNVTNMASLNIPPEFSKHQQSGDSISTSSETDLGYFYTFSKELLIQALKQKLAVTEEEEGEGREGTKLGVLRPFRILMSLLDKPEIGPVILESVLLSVFRCLYRESGSYSRKKQEKKEGTMSTKSGRLEEEREERTHNELIKTCNLLFGAFEPYFIWDYVARMFEASCQKCVSSRKIRRTNSVQESDIPALPELCTLVEYLLDVISLETFLETQTDHLPDLLFRITNTMTLYCTDISEGDMSCTIQLCSKLLSKVQPPMNAIDNKLDESEIVSEFPGEVNLQDIQRLQGTLKTDNDVKENGEINDGEQGEDPQTDQQSENKEANRETLEDSTVQDADQSTGGQQGPRHWTVKRQGSRYPLNMMQACVECYQNFFHVYTTKKILQSEEISRQCLEGLVLPQEAVRSEETDSVLDTASDYSYEDSFPSGVDQSNRPKLVTVDSLTEDVVTTFKNACKLLSEFSNFPIYCTDFQKAMKRSQSNAEGEELPPWLQDLITCNVAIENFEIQSATISIILELIQLTRSVGSDDTDHSTVDHSPTGGTVSVMILPALLPKHLKYLNNNTVFYKVLAEILWGFLDSSSPQYHQQAVRMFYLLHQVAPSSWVCEDVIGRYFVSDNEVVKIEAFKRFAVLWHLTRNIRDISTPTGSHRKFDRSMFVVLDSLREENSTVKAVATTWLTHLLQRGDIGRVLDPILHMLLHPDTARISIQHVNIHTPRKVHLSESSEEGSEAQIYAISSEGGNIIYHVSNEGRKITGRNAENLKQLALVMGEHGSTSLTPHEEELHFDRVRPDDLNLQINPWGSENSLDKFDGFDHSTPTQANLTTAKRLDKETCVKEGIFFGDEGEEIKDEDKGDNPQSQVKGDNPTSQEIVEWVLDWILNQVMEQTNAEQNKQKALERTASVTSSEVQDHDILNSIERRGLDIDSPTGSELDMSKATQREDRVNTDIHTLHMHMLLYTQKYDGKRTLYALEMLKSMLAACPRLIVTALVTTSISSVRTRQLAKLQTLLARHRKSIFGKNFFGDLPSEVLSSYRSNMFIEIMISVCLYFIRSYFPNLMMSKLSTEELNCNKEVQIVATEVLSCLLSELITIMKESGKSLMSYIKDLLGRCKLQKAILYSCLASVYNCRKKSAGGSSSNITEAIIQFNEENLDPSSNETFQIKLLSLLLVMIMLEHNAQKTQSESENTAPQPQEWEKQKVNFHQSLMNVKFTVGQPVVQQQMLLSCVLSALKQQHMAHMHRHWVAMVTSSLPYMGKSLCSIVLTVTSQLCRNLEILSVQYSPEEQNSQQSDVQSYLPVDHIVTILEGLTTLCHYCLLDNVAPVSVGLQSPSSTTVTMESSSAGQILNNLISVFNPSPNSREVSPARDLSPAPVREARNGLLSIMPRIIACMASLWRAVNVDEDSSKVQESNTWIMGRPKVIRQCVLNFLSPLSLPHGAHLLGAVGVAWNDRRKKGSPSNKKSTACEDQLLLVDLISAIKVLPTDTLVQTINKVLRQPPQTEISKSKKSIPLEVNMLQFFYSYVQQTPVTQLMDSWGFLLTLLRDGMQLNLSPPGKFLLLQILCEFVQKIPQIEEKKNQKELQELAQRLLEMIGLIAGSSLEQTTWLRRNLAVKHTQQIAGSEIDDESETDQEMIERKVADPKQISVLDSKYSVQALTLLAEVTAPLLDVIYSSDEKDKVAPFLSTILYNVFPYLRNHSIPNIPSFRACSQILSSVSGYQYTRKAWRKEAFELLMEPCFFQMDVRCIGYWRSVVDNLMTHDKTTFKDLMSRVTFNQSGSLNLFSSKEQELEQRAQMLKRLAFTIFCSEPDQYQKSMPDIQERLAESLRVPHQAPSIMAQVFLCVRVLILRMSSHQLTSLWPTVITEMVHVFMQIEQELSNDTDEFKTQIARIAALDSSWAHLGNGLNAHNNPAWLQLYLSVCKLLDLALALPADVVPQFQLYRWAFIGGVAAGNDNGDSDGDEEEEQKEEKKKKKKRRPKFVPHIIRLTKLINDRVGGATPIMKQTQGRPLLTQSYLKSLTELQPFFNTLCHSGASESEYTMAGKKSSKQVTHNGVDQGHKKGIPKSKSTPAKMDKLQRSDVQLTQQQRSNRQIIEELVERDFLEPCPLR